MNELAGALSNPFTVIAIVWLSDVMHISPKTDRNLQVHLSVLPKIS